MRRIEITLRYTDDPVEGWMASVARMRTREGMPTSVAIGESVIYPSKEMAWISIQRKVEALDFENDEIHFNHEVVNSYDDVLQMIDAL